MSCTLVWLETFWTLMSKGSRQRPAQIPQDELRRRWEETFADPKAPVDPKPRKRCPDLRMEWQPPKQDGSTGTAGY